MVVKVMMTLAAGCLSKSPALPATRPASGYTLLELLIVLVIIATLASVATLSLGGLTTDPAEKAARELQFNVELLSNEAIIRSEPLALGFFAQGYAFFHLPEDEDGYLSETWELIRKDRLLKLYEFDKALQQQVLAGEKELYLATKDTVKPQIFAMPTGEITPFEYQLVDTTSGNVYDLKFDALGRVVKPEAQADAGVRASE